MIDRLLQRIDPVEALTEPIVSLMPAQVTIIDVLIMLIAAIVYFWNNLSGLLTLSVHSKLFIPFR